MSRRGTERASREMEVNVHPLCEEHSVISHYGLGAGHYVSSHLENMELNTGRVKH